MAYQLSNEIKQQIQKDAEKLKNRNGQQKTSGNTSGGFANNTTAQNGNNAGRSLTNPPANNYQLSDEIKSQIQKDAEKLRSRSKNYNIGAVALDDATGKGTQPTTGYYNEYGIYTIPDPNAPPQQQSYAPAAPTRTRADIEKEIAQREQELNLVYGEVDAAQGDSWKMTDIKNRAKGINGELERLNAELWMLEQGEIYNAVPGYSDFAKNSAVTGKGKKDSTYLYINDINGARGTMAGQALQGKGYGNIFQYAYMTPEQIGIYNYLYNVSGQKAANKYLEYLDFSLYDQQNQAIYDATFEQAQKNVGTKIAASVASIPMNLGSGVGYLDVLGQKVAKNVTGSDKPINYNRGAQTAYTFTQGAREGTMEDMSDTGRFIYSTAMSMGDSLAVLGISVVTGGTAATALLGGSAATSTMHEAKKNGASDGQALAMGFVSGAAETIMEKLPLEELLNLTSASGVKAIVGQIVKQGANEATEEVLTTLVNTAADALIMGDKQELLRKYEEYIANGYSPEEAERLAKAEWWKGLATDAVGGFVSGLTFGAGGTIIQNSRANADRRETGKAISTSSHTLPVLIEHVESGYTDANTGETVQYSEETKKTAQQIKTDLAAGKNISNVRKGKLAEQILKDNASFEADVLPGVMAEVQKREDAASSEQSTEKAEREKPERNVIDRIKERLQEKTETKSGEKTASPAAAKMLAEEVVDGDNYTEETKAVAQRIIDSEQVSEADSNALVNGIKAENVDFSGYSAEEIIAEASVLAQEEAPQSTGAETTAETKTAAPKSTAQQTENDGGNINDQTGTDTGNVQQQSSSTGDSALSDRGRGRFSETYSGNAAPSSTGSRDVGAAKSRAQTADERINKVASLQVEPTTAAALGIEGGNEDVAMYIIPEEAYDNELQSIKADAESNGMRVSFFTGSLIVDGTIMDGSVKNDEMYIKADGTRRTAAETYDHEKFHHIFGNNTQMFNALYNWIRNNYTADSFDNIIDTYYDKYNDVYGLDAMPAEKAFAIILEEIFADAYAGINRFEAGATEYTAPVRAAADAMGTETSSEYNTNQGRAPPNGMTYDDVKRAVREVMSEVMGIEGNKNTAEDGGEKWAIDDTEDAITRNMTESERYRILSKKSIEVLADEKSGEYAEELLKLEEIQTKAKSKAEKIIKPLATKLGITNVDLSAKNVDISFRFTGSGGLSKSLHAQLSYGADYVDFAKALINLEGILKKAILIEVHSDKYKGTTRENENLEAVYVLFGAFKSNDSIVPVQLEIKKSSDVGGRLYMMVAMTKIEAGVVESAPGIIQTPSLLPTSTYKLSNIFGKINTQDKEFLKYIPNEFLDKKQKEAKYAALEKEKNKIAGYSKKENKNTMRFAISDEVDSEYLDAVERGDMKIAQRIVNDMASEAMPQSKIRTEDGELRVVYHGTNTGDFTVFNPDYIGMSSGDDGFFGMGFYFAYSKGEASYYGAKRIIPAFLNLTNPFDFERELQMYNGEKARSGHAPDAVALMNFADKFPEIAKDVTVGVAKGWGEDIEDISLIEFAKAFKEVIDNKTFEYSEVTNEYGEKETVVYADEKMVEYEYGGEKYSYRDYGFQKRIWGEPNRLDVAYEYLSNTVFSYIDLPTRTQVILDNNREFTAALKEMGYDGAIQSMYGDEAVAFYPEQIKSAETVTYDDDGKIIPLSQRFNKSNPDIRFALSEEADSDGELLTVGQAEFFADSKVRNDAGELMAMYHGTPNAGYTVFKPGTYFTPNKEYADVYQSQGASSLGYKKTADNPDTYKVYLNIKKPFDTRNQAEREIFENDYFGKWGMGTPLMDSGLPDWMDGGDLQEFLEEEGYDYDGLVLDEGGVGGYGDEVKSRGLSYVVFSPEQVKSVDNKTPTINPDYRFAISDEYDVAPEDRTWADTGDRKFNSYAFDHPELRPYFKEAARSMFYDLLNSVKGERWSTTSDAKNWTGSKRNTTENIARLLDNGHMTYKRIQEALLTMLYKAEDGKAMNRADVKKVELELDAMLQEGYTDPTGLKVEPNREYRRLLDAIKSGYSSVEESDAAYEAEVRDEAYEAQVEADVWEGYDQRADEMYDDVYSAYEPDMEAYEDISQEDRDYLGEIVESADELRLQRMADEKLRAAEELDEENEALRLRNMEYAEEANNYFDAYNYEELENERRRMDAVMQNALQNPDISAAPDSSAEHWESISAQLIEEKRRQKRENAVAEAENNDMYLPDGVSDAEILAAQEKYREQMAARKAADEAKYEGMTAEEAEAAKEADARRAQAEYLEGVDRKNFIGSDAMEKLKIKISQSIANYKSSAGLIERAKANAALVREMDKAIRKMHPSEEEKYFATGIMNNDLSEYSIPMHLDAERVLELADYMVARKAGRTDLFAAQKADINNRNRQLASDKFKNAEKAKRVSLTRLNYMTPRRAMIEMFGQEQGEEIYRTFFAPVRTNDAERIRFAERLRQEALEIVGADGKKGKLTKEERALTQMLMEGKAAGEMLAKMETGGKERIEAAAKRILKGEPLREENGKYVVGEEGADELSAKEAEIARRHAAYTQAQEAIRTGVFDKKKVDGTRINNAAKHFAQQYDMLYDAINEFLVAHGEEPIGFIKGYAPHLQAEGAMKPLERLLQWMGAPTDITDLRAEIAGETHNRKPNRKWNPHFLSRTVGSETEYDVYKGFEEYVDYISEVFYHMDDIMRLRAASRYLRTAYTTEDSKNQLKQIEEVRNGGYYEKMNFLLANNRIARGETLIGAEIDEALDKYIDEILNEEENKTAVSSSLVMWLDNYTNLLAGKQNAMDRGLEQQIGRKGIRAVNKAVNSLISAQVVGNISSALNQMAQMPMTITELGADNVSKALWDLVRHSGEMRRWSTENDFLAARKGTTILNYQITGKLTNGLAKPLELADWLMSSITARAAYHQALKQGMDVESAMDYSVQKAEDIMGSRNKASKPVAFNTKNPMMRLVNAYQIEVLNQWQHIIKDLPREYKSIAQSRGGRAAFGRIAKDIVLYLILAALINRIAEETYGGTPAPLDLLGIVGNFAASGNGLTLNEGIVRVINSMTGKMFGKEWLKENHTFDSEMPDEFDWGAAWEDTAYTLSSEIPFLNNIMAVAGLTDDETVFAAGINDAKESFFGKKGEGGAIDHFFVTRREREEGEQESAEVLDGLYDVAMGISEFILGGRQLQKTIQGVVTLSGGGEKNKGGNLMYPVEDTVGNWIKGTLFGKTALENSRAYYASGAAALSGKRNEQYYFMVENGINEETAYGVAQGLADVGDKFRDQMEYIMNTDLPDEIKNGLAFSVASEAAYNRYVSYDLESEGIEPAEFMFAWAFYNSATGKDTAGQTEEFLRQQGVSAGDIAKIIAALKKKK